jgi:hypothetical protein
MHKHFLIEFNLKMISINFNQASMEINKQYNIIQLIKIHTTLLIRTIEGFVTNLIQI